MCECSREKAVNLTEDLVVGTPVSLRPPEVPSYVDTIKEPGFVRKLENLTYPATFPRIDAAPDPDALARATTALQRAVARNRIVSATAPYRTGAGDTGQLGYQRAGRGSVELGAGDVAGFRLTHGQGSYLTLLLGHPVIR